MSDTCKYNCSAHPTEISAYGDISGIGVTTAFFATAWMVVLLLIGYYLVAYNPELDPFRQPGKKTPCQYPNAIDYVFLHAVRQLPGLRSLQYSGWLRSSQLESALNKCVIMFADIQIFTGLAVMISGYIALNCGLQSYHWQLTVYLVWLASLTHLAALSFLRNHLANSPSQLIWRAIAMFTMMVFLAVAVGLAGHFNWHNGPRKPSDFAACYFSERMDTHSVAFESMIKTLIILVYGFSIRLAKMSKPFEGGLRRVAAQLTTKVIRLQHRYSEIHTPRHSELESIIYESRDNLVIAFFSLLSIHINLLTSFLAEVYWLTLSALWVTRRFFKTRLLGPKEENDWTFGQVLPVLLAVAPLAAILEHFLPFRAPANRQRQQSSQIALAILHQLDRDEAQDDVQVDMDHQHIHSIAYRGTFLLAAAAYIEVGIFFVGDQSPGIKEPLTRLGVAFLVMNPLLQLTWIHCTLWIPFMNRSVLIKKTTRGLVFGAFMATSVNEFIQAWKKAGGGNEPLYSIATSYTMLVAGIFLSITTFGYNYILEGRGVIPFFMFCILFDVTLAGVSTYLGLMMLGKPGPLEFMLNVCVCLFLELVYYGLELFMEKMRITPKCAVYLRCALLFSFSLALVVLQFTTSIAPTTTILTASIVVSAALWSLVGAISSFVERKRAVTLIT